MSQKVRCAWCGNDELYIKYHDEEWGVAVYDDLKMFELLILETFQAGLSWKTILHKRENFRQAFSNFNPNIIANYNEDQVQKLMQNAGIVRNQLKIRAAINNANKYLDLQKEEGSFSEFLWSFVDGQPVINNWKSLSDVPATTIISDNMSKALKKKGFKFVGSTVMYAHMQACGLVQDHLQSCYRHSQLSKS